MIREHIVRVWLESRDLTSQIAADLAVQLDEAAADLHLVRPGRLTIELPVEATSPGKALVLGVQAVDAAINSVCPSLAGSALGCNWRRA